MWATMPNGTSYMVFRAGENAALGQSDNQRTGVAHGTPIEETGAGPARVDVDVGEPGSGKGARDAAGPTGAGEPAREGTERFAGHDEPDAVEIVNGAVERVPVLSQADRSYPHVFADRRDWLVPPQSNLILNPVPHYLSVDSRERDRTVWPNANQFRIPLTGAAELPPTTRAAGVRYKNVYSISLLSAVVPNVNNVLDQPYLLLQVDEIDGMYESASPACARAFAKLYFKEVCVNGAYLRRDIGISDAISRVYWPAPRASLDSITVSLRNYDGTLFDVGTDSTPPTDPLDDRQTSFTFEIRTFVPDAGAALGHRNP